jgi:endonuclease/exonuclease/phosphatase family metal-dependent hydrolase
LLSTILACVSCDSKTKTPDWNRSTVNDVPTTSALAPEITTVNSSKKRSKKSILQSETLQGQSLCFITYNVENWLAMYRHIGGQTLHNVPKPEKEKKAIIQILVRHHPDVIGLCEVGEASDLAEIQERLKVAGLTLPHLHYIGGSDPTRHLGILSRFPITATGKPVNSEYQMNGKTFGINRGILDVTLSAFGKSYHFIGLHLKSKRESIQGDQETIRLNEARLVRMHLDHIMETEPNSRIVLYGDLNDTRATAPIKVITGNYNTPSYMTAIPAKDSHGEVWTHFWKANDIYSRIDFIMVSAALKSNVDFKSAKIIDDPEWNDGSDHRPVLAVFE